MHRRNPKAKRESASDTTFTGKEEDVQVGLTYFGKRFLSPYLNRWVSADPLAVHVPGRADLNLYAYVTGRALRATDPVGLECGVNESCGFEGYYSAGPTVAAPSTGSGSAPAAAPTAAPERAKPKEATTFADYAEAFAAAAWNNMVSVPAGMDMMARTRAPTGDGEVGGPSSADVADWNATWGDVLVDPVRDGVDPDVYDRANRSMFVASFFLGSGRGGALLAEGEGSARAGGGAAVAGELKSVDPLGPAFVDPAPPKYSYPSKPVIDHRLNRARGGGDQASNLVRETWEANSRKAGFEGNYTRDLRRYMQQGLSRTEAEFVLEGEHYFILNDVHARPVDPMKLDLLPSP